MPENPSSPQNPRLRQRLAAAWRRLPWLARVFDWIGGHELPVLLAALGMVVGVWGFIEVADEVTEGDSQQFDEWAIRALRQPDDLEKTIGPPWLEEVGRDLTALGGMTVLALVIAAIAGFLWLRRLYGAMWLVLAATLGGWILSTALKLSFARDRPTVVPHLSLVHTSSFPSGHSMLSAVVYLTLGTLLARVVHERSLKAYCLIVALSITVLVGVSRVYLGVHYPSDVLAGWVAGMSWALLCWLIARYLQRRGKVEEDPAL